MGEKLKRRVSGQNRIYRLIPVHVGPEHFRTPYVFRRHGLFALLADIDHTRSITGKMFYPVAKYLDRKFGHRTTTHSLLCYFVLSLTVGVLEKIWSEDNIYSKIFIWAYGSHLIFEC